MLFVLIPDTYAATCGDGVVEGGEECDGLLKFIDGDPEFGSCTTGNRCFFEYSCCKFNCQFVGQGAPCQDGNACTSSDTCDQVGNCTGGPAVINGTACDDGLFCTGTESCQNGACTASTGNPCPETACNHCQEDTDSCFDPASDPCSDGSTCVSGGTCDGLGTCVGGVFNTGPCDDGIFCNGDDECLAGACSVHTGDPCTGPDGDAECNESCNEGDENCTGADPDGSACNDGLFCNGAADQCNAGSCSGTGSLACDDGDDCTIEACDEGLDKCTETGWQPNGTACDDDDACTIADECLGGVCTGAPTLLADLCPWALAMREHPTRDQIQSKTQIAIIGDLCGGELKLRGQTTVASDVVADEAAMYPLRLPPQMTVGGEIVSAGGSATAIPKTAFLPYTDPPISSLAGGNILAKSGASGNYDLTGTHDLVAACHAARTSFASYRLALDNLEQTQTAAPVLLKSDQSTTITAATPGGVNVIDVTGSIKVGHRGLLQLSGGGNPDTVVILRVNGGLSLLVSGALELTDGLTASNTLIYVKGKRCFLNRLSVGAGTLFCSPAKFTAQGSAWVGSVYADGKKLLLRNSALIYYLPFNGM